MSDLSERLHDINSNRTTPLIETVIKLFDVAWAFEKENTALEEALTKYGAHLANCALFKNLLNGRDFTDDQCDCGFIKTKMELTEEGE